MDAIEAERQKIETAYILLNRWIQDYFCLCPDIATDEIKDEAFILFQRMYATEIGELKKAPLEYVERYRPYLEVAKREHDIDAETAEAPGLLADVESFEVSESVNNDQIGDYALQICKEPNNIHLSGNAASGKKDRPVRLLDNLNNHLIHCHLYVILDEESWEPLDELKFFCKTEHIRLGISDKFLTSRNTELVSYANKAMSKFWDLWKWKRELIRKRDYWKFITVRGGELEILSEFDKNTIGELFCEKSMYEIADSGEILFFRTGIRTIDEKLARQLSR